MIGRAPVILLAAALLVAGPALAETPTEAVMAFYDQIGLELDPAARERFVDPARSVLDGSDRLRKAGEGDCLDPHMPQDNVGTDIDEIRKTLKSLETVKDDEAKVTIAFVAAGAPHRLQWQLRKVANSWKVSDILSATGEWALSQYHCE
ncbi:hypothetical protein [Mesorhizobium sp. CN2-181]|uniref:hypothetical protein n=1 Tax=Mesorhizobium yinganensis TaxID=3157707 RepID=UPI0032B738D1